MAPLDAELIQPREKNVSKGKIPVNIIEPLKDEEIEENAETLKESLESYKPFINQS